MEPQPSCDVDMGRFASYDYIGGRGTIRDVNSEVRDGEAGRSRRHLGFIIEGGNSAEHWPAANGLSDGSDIKIDCDGDPGDVKLDAELPVRVKDTSASLRADAKNDTTSTAVRRRFAAVGAGVSARSGDGRAWGSLGWQVRGSLVNKMASVSPRVVELLSFAPAEPFLRGTHSSILMHGGAAIFAGSGGSDDTYELSEPTAKLKSFISHNWVVPRWKKFLCLTFAFNFHIAALVTFLAAALIVSLSLAGLVPVTERHHSSLLPQYGSVFPTGYLCDICLCPLFVIVLLLWQEVNWFLGPRGALMFLDKTCIHQTDADLQRRSIEKLGAFLRASSTMTVLYTDTYLRKLWTVFEVAGFLAIKPVGSMFIVPVCMPIAFLSVVGTRYLGQILIHLFELPVQVTEMVFTMVNAFVCLQLWVHLARELDLMKERVAGFSVYSCECFVEADRPFVYSNIALLMRAVGEVEETDSDELALAAFNSFVQERVGIVIAVSMGYGLRYRHLLALGSVWELAPCLDSLAGLHYGMSAHAVGPFILRIAASCIAIKPLLFAGGMKITEAFLHAEHFYQLVLYFLALLGMVGLAAANFHAINQLAAAAEDSGFIFAGFLVYTAALTLATIAVYRCPQRHLRNMSGVSGSATDHVSAAEHDKSCRISASTPPSPTAYGQFGWSTSTVSSTIETE